MKICTKFNWDDNAKKIDEMLFDVLGIIPIRSESVEATKKEYKKISKLIKNEQHNYIVIYHKLEEVLGYTGSMNSTLDDFLRVMFILKNAQDNERYIDQSIVLSQMNELYYPETFSENYINTIYCVLHEKSLLDYGTFLQGAFMENFGLDILNPNLLSDAWITYITTGDARLASKKVIK